MCVGVFSQLEILLRKVQNRRLGMEDILKFQLINGWHITQFFGERFSPICWWKTWFMMILDNVIGTRCLIFLLIRHAWKFRCPFALEISFCTKCLGPLIAKESFKKCSNVTQDIFMLFRWLMDKLTRQELERWAVMAWVIWNAWNKYYFEHSQTYPKSILNGELGSLQEYQHLIAAQSSNWLWSDWLLHVCYFSA